MNKASLLRQFERTALNSLHAIGIDVGGTKIAAGLVDLQTGAVASRRQVDTEFKRGGEPVLADVRQIAIDLMAQAARSGVDLQGIGIGVAELVSPEQDIFSGYRIAWKGLDVKERLSHLLPTAVNSDVRAAARAESRFGAGRPFRQFIYVTIGTGVSAVLVQDGEPFCGSRGAALVIGNGPTRRVCGTCGEVTMPVLEDIASGPGIAAAYGTSGGADEVLQAAAGGDARAIAVIDHAASELGQVLALLVNSLDPEAVIVGGGLGCAPGRYWDRLQAAIRAGLWDRDERMLVIYQAELGTDAGLIGAALGTIDHTKNRANGHITQGKETTGLLRSGPETAKGSLDNG